jgi:two-component system sensor histidine kinase KdpD
MSQIDENRPDPDELLASLKREEEKERKGKLKIFFGMCAGVGKTYSMLQAAQAEKLKGIDVVIGYVETHNRKETAELVEGLPLIPRKQLHYKGTHLQEMDLDAILERRPQIVLVDELAHTNAPGSRHLKRYQDVMEILENGINVYTTVNVQHLESRSETVAQITGIVVRETLPDEVFETADEVEVVDLTPEELLERLSEGKVYTLERSREAIESFFRKGNITALREMALRIVADRVDKQLLDYMQQKRIRGPWKSGLHLLVAVDYTPQSTKLLRWAKNLSSAMGAGIQAVYVETLHQLTPKETEQLDKNIALAKQLGIKFRIVTNTDAVKAIVDFAHKENATHIIVGKPRVRHLMSMLQLGTFVNRLIRYSGNIDIYILGADKVSRDRYYKKASMPAFTSNLWHYLMAALSVVIASLVCYSMSDLIEYQVTSFALLIVVAALGFFYSTGPVLLAATLSAIIWDFFFILPKFTLHIERPVDVLMLVMFFVIALLSGVLTSRVRRQEQKIRIREERTQALYQLTKDLNLTAGFDDVANLAIKYIHKYFSLQAIVLLKDEAENLVIRGRHSDADEISDNDLSIASWTFKHSQKAGKYTDTLPASKYTFYPLKGINYNMGVVAVSHPKVFTQGEENFWEGCLTQISGKFEREYLRNEAKKAFLLTESDKLYKTLFNSISHELRIPVATIMGASDTLLSQVYPVGVQKLLLSEINTASVRLNRLIENLLNMSRLESGRITPRYDWCDVHDLVNKVTASLVAELGPFNVEVVIPADMPLVQLDFGLIEQVLHNLVLNATQNTLFNTTIRIKFFYENKNLTIQVMDRGKGFPAGELTAVFNKFYRGKDAIAGGTGLGLSIVKGFVEAHGGSVEVTNRQNGGAIFTIRIKTESRSSDEV